MNVVCKNARSAHCVLSVFIIYLWAIDCSSALLAANLSLELKNSKNVIFLGAIQRWDQDGNQRRIPDPKAKIDSPAVDATAEKGNDGKWVFKNLPSGKYDLVLQAKDKVRIEGFQFAPVKEVDPFIQPDATIDEETRDFIIDDINKSPYYENKVMPLYLAGDKKAVRVFIMLIRDKPTSYEEESPGAATMRHEIWQYSWNYGAWKKEKRTIVLDRILMPRDQLRQWTWLWDPKLGGIELKNQSLSIKYDVPKTNSKDLKGLYPY
jgi:hypothetical protein